MLDGNIITDEELKIQTEESGPYDIVVANIVADVIIPLSGDVRRYLKKDGVFIACGIIEPRLGEVKAAIENAGFRIKHIENENDWYCIISTEG